MKESQVKQLAQGGRLKKIVVERTSLGARSSSDEKGGWLVKVNAETLESARKPVRVFASLDTLIEKLEELGVKKQVICLALSAESIASACDKDEDGPKE